jgi:hypothetical protein
MNKLLKDTIKEVQQMSRKEKMVVILQCNVVKSGAPFDIDEITVDTLEEYTEKYNKWFKENKK